MKTLLIAAAMMALPATAVAQTIAVESHAGARPDDAGDLVQPVVNALAGKGVSGGAELEARIRKALSAPSATAHADALATAATVVDNAARLAERGAHAQIVGLLGATIDVYRAEPAAVAADPDVRDRAFRARVLLATAQLEVGNADQARALVDELATSFPDRPVEGKLAPLYAEAVAARDQRAKGKLALSCSDPAADLFVDERKVGTGSATVELPAGEYRVLARAGDHTGRLYRATVEGGKTATVAIDANVDGALRTEGAFVGLVFADEATRTARERDTAIALARGVGAKRVVVLGLRERDGNRALIAAALDGDSGKLLLAASIAVAPLATYGDRAAALADYLAGGAPGEGVEPLGQVAGSGKTELPPTPPTVSKSYAHVYYWAGAGLGVALLAGGIYMLAIDGDGTCSLQLGQTQCPEVYDTATPGIAMIAGGAVLAGAGTYFALRAGRSSDRERRGISIVPTRGGLAVGYRGRF